MKRANERTRKKRHHNKHAAHQTKQKPQQRHPLTTNNASTFPNACTSTKIDVPFVSFRGGLNEHHSLGVGTDFGRVQSITDIFQQLFTVDLGHYEKETHGGIQTRGHTQHVRDNCERCDSTPHANRSQMKPILFFIQLWSRKICVQSSSYSYARFEEPAKHSRQPTLAKSYQKRGFNPFKIYTFIFPLCFFMV